MFLRLALVAMLFLTGCMLGPDYQRPSFMIPDNYRDAQGAPARESLADLPWWELFQDPVLQDLTKQALVNNYDLRTAAAGVEDARAQVGVTRSFLYPQFDFRSGGTAQQVSRASDPTQAFGANRNFQNCLMAFNVIWEIDVFGRIR